MIGLTGIRTTEQAGQIDFLTGGTQYGAILADPAWQFATRSDAGRDRSPDGFAFLDELPLLGAEAEAGDVNHYETMPTAEICALPVGVHAARDCALFLWATIPMLLDALQVIEAWGFQYKSARVWAKLLKGGFDPAKPVERNFTFGTGYIVRGNPELLLIATKGSPRFKSKSTPALILAPIREHSRKPDLVRRDIERMVDGPYLELNSRTPARGWDAWGDQLGTFQEQT